MDIYFVNVVKTGNVKRMDTFYYFFCIKSVTYICTEKDTKNNNNTDGNLFLNAILGVQCFH